MAASGIALGLLGAPAATADPAVPVEPPPPAAEVGAIPASVAVEQQETPHLPSPDNLPPGTTQTAPERRTLGYLRDIWNAVRTEDVSMADAILLLAQRPLDSMPTGATPRQAPSEIQVPAEAPAPPVPADPAP